MHFRVALAASVHGGVGRCDQRGVHHGAVLAQQILGLRHLVDDRQDLFSQLAHLQEVMKPQDRALVGQPALVVQPRKLPKQRHVVQGFFHRRVAQREPLLQDVDAQYRLHIKGRTPVSALWRVRRDQDHQRRPGHHALHLLQEFTLAGALGAQVQAKCSL